MKENQIQIFNNTEFGEIRTMEINGEPWFAAKDISAALGYTNPRKAVSDHVDSEDKGVTKCDTLGGSQNLTIINESGLETKHHTMSAVVVKSANHADTPGTHLNTWATRLSKWYTPTR